MVSVWRTGSPSSRLVFASACKVLTSGGHARAGSHDNIVALRGLVHHENRFHLVMEYCYRGTLDVLLHHTMNKKWEVRATTNCQAEHSMLSATWTCSCATP